MSREERTPAEQLVWIDCEMTGLDVDRDALCEIAVIVTDFALMPVHPGFTVVINPGENALAAMDDLVRNMHERSGLLPLLATGVDLAEAQLQTTAYLRQHVTAGRAPIVAGNTIAADRRFIAKYLPGLEQLLHYRSVDVSTVKELTRRWYPQVFAEAPKKRGEHRALVDIAESIRELAYFRETVFGVDADASPNPQNCRQIAAMVSQRYAPLIESIAE